MTGDEYARRQIVSEQFRVWRRIARQSIRADGKDPSFYHQIARDSSELSLAYCAAMVLKRLDHVEAYLRQVYRLGGASAGPATEAIREALVLLMEVHHMTVADSEREIVTGLSTIRGAKAGGKARSMPDRDREMAHEYLRRRADEKCRMSDTALKVDIGEKMHRLGRRASIDAVDRGLKIICAESGQTARLEA
jgi:hypothetical protein